MLENNPLNGDGEYFLMIHSHKNIDQCSQCRNTKQSHLTSCHNASLTSYTSCISAYSPTGIPNVQFIHQRGPAPPFPSYPSNILEFIHFILASSLLEVSVGVYCRYRNLHT